MCECFWSLTRWTWYVSMRLGEGALEVYRWKGRGIRVTDPVPIPCSVQEGLLWPTRHLINSMRLLTEWDRLPQRPKDCHRSLQRHRGCFQVATIVFTSNLTTRITKWSGWSKSGDESFSCTATTAKLKKSHPCASSTSTSTRVFRGAGRESRSLNTCCLEKR